jgi:hypothetical protein
MALPPVCERSTTASVVRLNLFGGHHHLEWLPRLCRHYPNWLLQLIVTLLFAANAINIGADLCAMADATKLLIGGSGFFYVVIFAALSVTGRAGGRSGGG